MKKRNRKKTLLLIVGLILILSISVGTAILGSLLTVGGNTTIKENSWVIYFDNVRKSTDSVSSDNDARITNNEKTRIEFSANLKEPGDFYEFTVYTVNDGSIDAMINSIDKSELTAEQQKYLDFIITYDNGRELKKCDPLDSNTRRRIKAIVKFKDGVDANDYPQEDVNLDLYFDINYIQKEDSCHSEEFKNEKILTIDPNGGKYENRQDEKRVYLEKNGTYTLQEPTRFNYNFLGWIVESPEEDGTYILDENEFTMGDEDVTLKADWKEGNFVARIMNNYYETVQEAFDAVDSESWQDNTVYLIRNVSETPTNTSTSDFTFNLGGYTLTGMLTNPQDGNIRLVNGKVKADDEHEAAVLNYGTVVMGIPGGGVQVENSISLQSKNVGIRNVKDNINNGKLYIYDGYIEAKVGLVGGYTDKEENYAVFSEHVSEKNAQRIYLIRNPKRAVALTETEGRIYYYNLQDAIISTEENKKLNSSFTDDDYIVYAYREFEAAYGLNISEGSRVVFDLQGHDITTGENITNNGYFKITNSSHTNSRYKPAESIDNNGQLDINNLFIISTTDKAIVDNKGALSITTSTLQGYTGYAVDNKNNGTITMDLTSTLKSESAYGLHNSSSSFNLETGNVLGIYNEGTMSISNTAKVHNSSNGYAVYNKGTFDVNGGEITDTKDEVLVYNLATLNVNNGLLSSTNTTIKDGIIPISEYTTEYIYVPNVNINGGTVLSTESNTIDSLNVTVNSGTITSENKTAIISTPKIQYISSRILNYVGKVNVNGGEINGKEYGVYTNELTITNGTINSDDIGVQDFVYTYRINNNDYKINSKSNISGGTINSTNNGLISEHLTMTNGNITSTNSNAIVVNVDGTITGGTAIGDKYGVLSNGKLTIGTDDNNISSTSPELVGEFYGLYIEGDETNFYDGVLKGQSGGYNGTITGTPTGAIINQGTEIINNETYETKYIKAYDNWLQVGDYTYNSIDEASNAITDTGTITVIQDANVTFIQRFLDENNEKNIIFDLNGHTITTTQPVYNYSNVTIIDSSNEKTGKINSTRTTTIINELDKSLTIDNLTINNTSQNITIENSGDMVINNANIKSSKTAITNYNNLTINNINIYETPIGIHNHAKYVNSKIYAGKTIIEDGTINTTDTAFLMSDTSYGSNGKITINNGTIYGNNNALRGNYGSIEINDGNISSNIGSTISTTYYNTIVVNGGTISSTEATGIESSANITINNGTISGVTGIKNVNTSDRSITINNGHIIGTQENGIEIIGNSTNVKLYVYSGIVEGATNGIHSTGRVQIGRDDENINIDTPSIIGHTNYGLLTDNYSAFYDGTLKGKEEGYHGLISIIPDGSLIKSDYEYINKIEYQTDYLIAKGNWLRVGTQEFNSINKAADVIDTAGEMIVIADAYIDFSQTIPTGKNITLDLDGHSLIMTQPLTTKGELTIVNSKDNGGISNLRDNVILNQGKTTIEGGIFRSETTSVIKNTSNFILNGGTIQAPKMYGVENTSTFTMNGGTITSQDNSAVYSQSGTTTINGGEITAEKNYGIYLYNGTTNVNNGTIKSLQTSAIYEYGYYSNTTLNITGGELTGHTYGITNSYYNNTMNISGGHIVGETESGIQTSSNTNITGGNIEGIKYGLYVNDSTSYIRTVNLGTNDGTIDIDAPILKGDLYGLYISNGTVNFYDGIIKGITNRHSGIISSIASHAQIFEDEEIIDRKNYYTEYLVTETEIAINTTTNVTYGNLQEAIDEANSNETIKLLSNIPLYYELLINNPNVILDLNGNTISTNKKIINNVPFTITNTSENEAIIKISSAVNLITNNSELSINNVTLKNNSSQSYVINNQNKLTVTNSKIDCLNAIENHNEATINNTNVIVTRLGISNTGKLNINGGTYSCTTNGSNYYSIYSNSNSNINIANATINGIFYNSGENTTTFENGIINGNIQNYTGTLIINDSNIRNGKVTNTGSLTLNRTTYKSTIGGNYNYSPEVAIVNSNIITLNNSNILVNTDEIGRHATVITNTGTVNINEESFVKIGMTNTTYDYKAIQCTGSGKVNIDNSEINVQGGSTSYGIYINGDNAKVIITTGKIDVEKATTSYGVYTEKGTFEMGHYEGTGYEHATVSTTNPLIYVQGNSRGIGVKKTNGSFNFYDGIIRASKYAKPETTTNVEYQFEVTTYVDENTGFEYALLEWMQNDYQGDTVALLNGVYYKTVQEAIDKAETGDQITLLRSVSEDLTVPLGKNVKINLNKHSITTEIINSGTLNVYNGSLQNFDKSVVINYGTFIMGEDDSRVSNTNIRVISESTTIQSTGTLIIYDGYIEGVTALEGKVDQVAAYARIRTETDENLEKKYIQSLSQEAILSGETDLLITIDPASGYYEGSKAEKEIFLKHGESYELLSPTKNGCTFLGWDISDENAYDETTHLITVDLSDINVTAKWEVSEDAVAKIGEDYFTTLQDALDNASDGDKVELFKNVTENVTNRANVTLDLGGYTVTGAFINQGELKILNGVIENTNGIGLENRKSLTLGENDGEIQETIIQIIGTTVGLQQDGKFNFYDGFIEGDVALSGKIDNVPQGYFLYNDHNSIKDCQRVYLIGNPANAVAVIENGGTQYFFNLQDAIDTAALTGSTIFIARDFEGTYPITIPANKEIDINMSTHDITLGNDITINGTLNLFDASEDKIGSIAITKTITNKGTLNINKVNINQNNTSNATITNTGNVNLTNTTITSKNGYTINTSGDGNLQIGENVVLTATGNYAIYNNQNNPLEINTGKITSGINNAKELTIGGNIEIKATGRYAVYMSAVNSKFTMNNGYLETNTHVIYTAYQNSEITINNGHIKGTGSTYVIYDSYNTSNESQKTKLTINDGIIEGNYHGIYLYGNVFTMNGGTITSYYQSSSSQQGCYALYCASNTSCSINEGSKIIGENTSAIYKESNSKDLTITGAEIISNSQNGFGIHNVGGNITITDSTIEATGIASYGIYYNGNGTNKNITLNNVDINSRNIGVYITTSDNQNYESTLTVNSGTVFGDTYGIQQANQYTTVTIGTTKSESQENPYVRGNIYGIYKTAGVTNFYSGKLGGATYGYNDEIDNITTKKEITEDTEQNLKNKTLSTTNHSLEALSETPKEGNGYAKLTYIDEDNNSCVNGQEFNFSYTGREQLFQVPCTGKYKLEVWGAQGGSYSDNYPGGYGGYSKGEVNLIENAMLYINVGGQGIKISENNVPAPGGYNGGGGVELTKNSNPLGTGGGATHIATQSGLLSSLENNIDSILIVAGGGGGSDDSNRAASGGGYIGANSARAKGGTQTEGGNTSNGSTSGKGKFGQGGGVPANYGTAVGYGGGGFYGGGSDDNGGAGGSGYINNPLLSNAEMYGYSVPTTQVDFIINYLINKDTFLKVSNNEFSSFEEAIDYIDDNLNGTGTIELLKDTTVQTSVTIPSTNNIIFDLAGHTLTMTISITNKGTFNIIDSSEEKTGKITNTNTNAIINQKDLTITNGTISTAKKNAININNSSTKTIIKEGVKITGNNSAIIVSGAASELSVTNAELTGSTYGIYLNAYNIKLDLVGTTLKATNGSALYDSYASNSGKNNITINGGTVEGTTYGAYLNYSNLTTQDTTIKTTSNNTSHFALNMNSYSPLVTINEGTHILSPSTSAVRLNTNLTMNDGEIKAEGNDSNGISFYDNPGGAIAVNIYGGSVYGKKYGIFQKHTNITTTIGNKDEELSQENPLIEGGENGISKESGTTNLYSGRLKGIRKSYNGEFSKVRKNKSIYTMEEVIDEEDPSKTYKISYLVDTEGFLEVDGTIYNNFVDAIEAINGTGTIKVLNDKLVYEDIEIPVGKTITIDFNNHKVTTSQTITNNSILIIKDDSEDKGGYLNNVNENTIENNGTLTISNIKIQSVKTAIYGKTGTSSITINGNTKVYGETGINLNSAQSLSIDNSTVNGASKGINLQADNTTATINECRVTGGTYGIYTYGQSNNITITDTYINSASGSGIYDERSKNADNLSTISITGGTITATQYGVYSNLDNLNITGTTITNNSQDKTIYGVYCNSGSSCNLNDGTIINAQNSSGLYTYGTTTLKGVEINSNGNDSYGIYVNGETLTLDEKTKVNAYGNVSYGIYADQNQTTITIEDADVYSKNIGIYLGNAKNDSKTLNVNHGSVIGETYGISQTVANGKTTIGNADDTNSIEDPYIEGGLISIKKDAGLLYFYSGRLKGYLKGNPGTVDYVRDGYEIFEDSDEIQLYLKNKRTISISEVSETPLENTAKSGNGAAKITYIESIDDLETVNYQEIASTSTNVNLSENTEEETYDFTYNGAVQEFEVTDSGIYKLEVWGAQGGTSYGGKGGYSIGYVHLNTNDNLYIYVGEKGDAGLRKRAFGGGGFGYGNGASNSSDSSTNNRGGGGGATDIRINNDSLYARVIVAGGGGGGFMWSSGAYNGSNGGGLTGVEAATRGNPEGLPHSQATQIRGGNAGYSGGSYGTKAGTFGQGGDGTTGTNTISGGGGGWYGGGGSNPGTGGSGWVYTEDNYLYWAANSSEGQNETWLLDEEYYLEEAETISGNKIIKSPLGSNEVGHSGNGYARITLLQADNINSDYYTVNLKTNYGTIQNPELIYEKGQALGEIPQPVFDNQDMEFVGWFTNRSYSKKVNPTTIVNNDTNLYAKFKYTNAYCTATENTINEFDLTNSSELYIAKCPGKYKLEVWGAQGGNSTYGTNSNTGGYGAYSSGIINLKREEKIYVTVGGKGESTTYNGSSVTYDGSNGYNGGGSGTYYSSNSAQGGGGGATHIAKVSGQLSSLSELKSSVMIVAGGGGGAITSSTGTTFSGDGGSGGGLVGGSAIPMNDNCYNYGTGGTQNNVGTYKACSVNGSNNRDNNPPRVASFGLGSNYSSNTNSRYYAGGGAGWYGGQSGYRGPGGGGSGYVGYSGLTDTIMYGYNIDTYYDDDITNIAYLVENTEFVKNIRTNQTYLNLQTAIDEAEEDDTLQLIADSNISYDVMLVDGKKITIDFNGHNIATSKQITNNGNLTLVNTDNSTSTITNNISITLFENNGVLSINDINIKAYLAISNTLTGRVDLTDTNINATSQGIVNEGLLNIDTSTIYGTTYGIYSNSNRTDTITNSTIGSASTAFYKYNLGKTTMLDTTINGQIHNNKTGAVLEIIGGTVNGLTNNLGNTTIKNANIEYNSNVNNTEYQIRNSGLLTLKENTIKYQNYTYQTSGYQHNNIFNTGTLTSNDNEYINEYNYSNTNNYSSYRYKSLYNIQNQGILYSTNDSYEAYGGSNAYAVYNNSNNQSTVINPTIKLHNNNYQYGLYNYSGNIVFDDGTIELYSGNQSYGVYTYNGTPTISGTNINIHDNSSTSYGLFTNSGTTTYESGTVSVRGNTVYGAYNNSTTATLVLGIEDGSGTDAADVSTTNPHIEAIGSNTGIGVRMGDGSFNYFDGYITGSTSPRGQGDITSKTDKNYQVVTKHNDETGYDYCILEFIK